MRKWIGKFIAALSFCLCLTPLAEAQSCSGTISSPITFVGVDPLAAGSYDVTATLNVTCSGFATGATIAVCPDLGPGSAGFNGSNQRLLMRAGSADTLSF